MIGIQKDSGGGRLLFSARAGGVCPRHQRSEDHSSGDSCMASASSSTRSSSLFLLPGNLKSKQTMSVRQSVVFSCASGTDVQEFSVPVVDVIRGIPVGSCRCAGVVRRCELHESKISNQQHINIINVLLATYLSAAALSKAATLPVRCWFLSASSSFCALRSVILVFREW
jgi:hypothetical protein